MPEECKVEKPNRDFGLLAPFFRDLVMEGIQQGIQQGIQVDLFEGYRSPERQQWLWEQGRTRPGKVVTKARPWRSYHQLGLAADLVFYDGRRWSWDGPWDALDAVMEPLGFEALPWERPHYQITGGLKITEAVEMYRSEGKEALWALVESRLESAKP